MSKKADGELTELMMVNPKGKAEGPKKKKKKSGKKKTAKRTGAAKTSRRKNPAKKTKKRRSKGRKRNPGIDGRGSLAAFAGGVLGYVLGQPAATFAGGLVGNKIGRGFVKAFTGGVVPTGLGVLTQMMWPNVGKGLVAAGGSQLAAHALATITSAPEKPIELLQRAGFTQLGDVGDVYERDGQYWKRMEDGTEQHLLGASGEQYTIDDGGEQKQAVLLGRFADGSGIATTGPGEFVVVEGLEERGDLAGLEQRTDVAGDDDHFEGAEDEY